MKKNIFMWKQIDNSGKSYTKLDRLLSAMKTKWDKEIRKTFGKDKDHFILAGGNYTYFFLLSRSFKFIQKMYPFLPVHLKLLQLELKSSELYDEYSFDLLLSSNYVGVGKSFFNDIKSTPYKLTRKRFQDAVYFGASKKSILDFGSKQETLRKHYLLFGRLFKDDSRTQEISYLFSTKPKGRETEYPRVITDQIYLSHVLMEDSIGIWLLFKSSPTNNKLARLSDAIQHQQRFFVTKKNESSTASNIRKRIMNLFREEKERDDED